MKLLNTTSDLESVAARLSYCIACGSPKQKGELVCRSCFELRNDFTPLKYFDGTLDLWIFEYIRPKVPVITNISVRSTNPRRSTLNATQFHRRRTDVTSSEEVVGDMLHEIVERR